MPVAMIELRVAAGGKLNGFADMEQRTAFGPELLQAMWRRR